MVDFAKFKHLFLLLPDGIVSYMKKQAGPVSKEYTSLEAFQKRLVDIDDNLIVGKEMNTLLVKLNEQLNMFLCMRMGEIVQRILMLCY